MTRLRNRAALLVAFVFIAGCEASTQAPTAGLPQGFGEALDDEFRKSPVGEALHRDFRDAYDLMVTRAAGAASVAEAGASLGRDTELLMASKADVATRAPDDALTQWIEAYLDFTRRDLELNGPEACVRRVALEQGSPTPWEGELTVANLAVIARAEAEPTTRDEPNEADYELFGNALLERGIGAPDLARLQEPDASDTSFCATLIKVYEAAAEVPGSSGSRVRATMVRDSLKGFGKTG